MSDEQNEVKIFETRRFERSLNKLSDSQLKVVEDEIDKVISDPEIGELEKGDLSHLRVHKFKLEKQQVLLGYSWFEEKLELYLLQVGSHENFYQKQKTQRKADLKFFNFD